MAAEDTVTGVAGRYATALYDLADEAGALDNVADDLRSFRALLSESEDFRRLVRSPLYSHEEQWGALDAVMAKAGTTDLVRKFLGVVTHNRRLFALDGMITAYLSILAERRGEVTAQVTSAHPLDEQQISALKGALKNVTGRDVNLETQTDAGLLGGLVVKVGSRMIDSSLRTKLNSLKIAMKEAG